jgi:hypothetical protein
MHPRTGGRVAAFIGAVIIAAAASAQTGDKYTARLSMVPAANAAQQANVAGKGTATALLAGTKLTISGSFEGLPAPATAARVHQGVAKGARGKAFADLTISKATSGALSGSLTLTPEQLEALKSGRLYVQVHSEKGVPAEQGKVQPDVDNSNLWGWFLR